LKDHIAKLASLSDDEFDHFFSFFKPASYKKGEAIFKEGDKVECEYFVIQGCLKSFLVNDDMKMLILQFSMPTWWASDYNALQNGTKATINLDCVTMQKYSAYPKVTETSCATKFTRLNIFFVCALSEAMWLFKKDCCPI